MNLLIFTYMTVVTLLLWDCNRLLRIHRARTDDLYNLFHENQYPTDPDREFKPKKKEPRKW